MFKAARWKSDKNKIKIVFKLQFQATQVPLSGWDTLMVSLVPVDVGKPTVRSEKAPVRDGACRWDNPIYETVKFNQDAKSGKFHEKIYKLIVSSGASKYGIVGEVTIDFSDYIEAVKPSSTSLPFKSSNSGALLHITIQRLHGDGDRREVEENEAVMLKPQDGSFKKTTPQNAESNGNPIAFKVDDTISTSGSESSSERNTPRELGMKNNHNQDPTSFLSSLSYSSLGQKPTPNATAENHLEHRRTNTDWSVGSAPDGSIDGLSNSSEDNHAKERSAQVSDLSVEKLKSDLAVLARQAEVSGMEIQTLKKQIMKESKRGQDLSREVVILKEERDSLRKECEQLKAAQKHIDETKNLSKLPFEGEVSTALLKEIRQELSYEKDLNANLRLQLTKTQESNSELILAVQDLDEMLEKKNMEVSHLLIKSPMNENAEKLQEVVPKHETDDDEEQQALEGIIKEHDDAKEAYLLEQKVIDLYSELDVCRRDRDELEMQMEQLALDYEILKQENHDLSSKIELNQLQDHLKIQCDCSASLPNINELESQVESLEKELNKQEEEFSNSLATISELETLVKRLEKELNKQEEEFSNSSATISELETQVKSLENELNKQEEEFSTSLATVSELESQVKSLEEELSKQEEDFSTALATISELKTQVKRLEKELNKQEEELSNSSATISELETQVKSLENELNKQEEESSTSLATISELESQVKSLEEELSKQEEDFSTTLATISELKTQVRSLEEELEKQAEGFGAGLEAVTRAKVEQEQRAIRAEEALRKTRWANANTAERLQEEFRRLSNQMASTFDANEKMAMKALTEANEMRLHKIHLEEMLEKANEELALVKDRYEEKLKDLSDQINQKTMQAEEMALELENKSKKLENLTKQDEETCEDLSKDIQMLRAEIERLREQKSSLSRQEEQKEKLVVEAGNVERNALEKKIASVMKEAEQSLEELNNMRSLKDEKETVMGILQSEVEVLRSQCNDLKHSLFENELEKETLRKQVFHLKSDLQKKEDMVTIIEKQIKDSNGRAAVTDKTKLRNNKSAPISRGSKDAGALLEKIKSLEMQIKSKEAALEKSTNSFLEKENELYDKIEELEKRMEEMSQSNTNSCEDRFEKEIKDGDNVMTTENGIGTEPIKSNNEEKDSTLSPLPNGFQLGDLNELLSEVEQLKNRNKSMEGELKDMQERYSEISLKFAEVEGERQQLVMTVRNLKNAKK